MKLPKFFSLVGIVTICLYSLYVLVTTVLASQQSSFVSWMFAGAALMYSVFGVAFRFFLFKKEFDDENGSSSRMTMILYSLFALAVITAIYGRMYFYSVPKGEKVAKSHEIQLHSIKH